MRVQKIIIFFSIFFFALITNAQEKFLLKNDSLISVKGFFVRFKGNTEIKYSKNGKVLSGTLAEEMRLWTAVPSVLFAANSGVQFTAKGKLKSGRLSKSSLLWSGDKNYNFSKSTIVIFNNKGNVIYGTIDNDIVYELNLGYEVQIASGYPVSFDDLGNIISGTLLKSTELPTLKGRIVLSENSIANFSSDGCVLSGTLGKKTNLKISFGKKRSFEKGSFVKFDEKGFVLE